jgi:hypothetical protein
MTFLHNKLAGSVSKTAWTGDTPPSTLIVSQLEGQQ